MKLFVMMQILSVMVAVSADVGFADLRVYYEFEGNVNDSIGTNHGTEFNSPTYAAGVSGQALNLGVSNAYVSVPSGSDVSLRNTGVYTVSAWVYFTNTNHQMMLFRGLGCSSWASWYLSVGGSENSEKSGKFIFGVRSSNGSATTQLEATAITGRWVHLAVSYDGATLKFYIDGIEADNVTTSSLPYDNSENLYLGGDPGCGGRSMYHRWEYIDKEHRMPKSIYSMNPGGTKVQDMESLGRLIVWSAKPKHFIGFYRSA